MINWDLIRMLISLAGIVLMIIFIVKINKSIKKGTPIKGKILLGTHCYSCKGAIDEKPLENFVMMNPNFTKEDSDDFFKKENFRLCTSCKRDDTLNIVTNKSNFILKAKKYLYSNKSKHLPLYYLIIYFTLLGLDFWLRDTTRFFFYAYNVALFAYWYVIFKRIDLDYINKEK